MRSKWNCPKWESRLTPDQNPMRRVARLKVWSVYIVFFALGVLNAVLANRVCMMASLLIGAWKNESRTSFHTRSESRRHIHIITKSVAR